MVPHSILETVPESEDTRSAAARELQAKSQRRLGFVVLWSADEPDKIGAFLQAVTHSAEGTSVLGRGAASSTDSHPRLVAVRQRPQINLRLGPFESPSLSRVQLSIRPTEAGQLELVNLGRRRLFVNGQLVQSHLVVPGDIIELGGQLTLLCALRPACMEASAFEPNFEFGSPDPHGYVGESLAAWRLRGDLAFAAPKRGHVLVLGNSGTGKELVANAIHAISKRSGPLVARNAATIPESLVDAELFGNMKGYPNPGMPERKGLFGAAHGGTLFLDEFGDLPPSAQAHVLRVLDAGDYHRLGEDNARHSDFRLVAATNRPESALRADVVARFEFRLRTPDLPERCEDIPLLACHLLALMCKEDPKLKERFFTPEQLPRLSSGFVKNLVRRQYDANVRDLRNLLWLSVSQSRANQLEWPEVPASDATAAGSSEAPDNQPTREALQQALDDNNGSIEQTWRALGLPNRHVLNRLVRKHGLRVTRKHGHD